MRITSTMMADQFLTDANASLNRLAKAQQQVDSTKRISNIADDPLATISSLKARNKLSNLADYQSGISTASSYLKENANAVDSLNSVLESAYELMVSMKSGGKTESDLQAAAKEMSGLQDEVFSIANTTLGTTYLFNGSSSQKPFSIETTTGHLIYNGIDLSQVGSAEEYQTSQTAAADAKTVVDGYITTLGSDDTSDYYAKNTVCSGISAGLDDMISAGNAAVQAAKDFDANTDTTALQSALDDLTKLKAGVESAAAKPLQSELIEAGTVSEGDTELLENLGFNKDNIYAMLQDPDTGLSKLSATFNTALESVATSVKLDDATSAALETEKSSNKMLKIGSTQQVQISTNGLDLLGSGSSNIFLLLGRCTSALQDGSDLSNLVSGLQDAQSNVLSLDTDIGTSQNRISMLSDRYVTSKATYTEMKSNAEDADMAEAITTLTTAKTVYNAALAAGAKIVQTSLIDFLT